VLAYKIDDALAAIALLDVCERERRHFGPSETTTEEHGQNGAIAQPFYRRDIRRAEASEPAVARANFPGGCTPISRFYAGDAGRQFRCE